MYNFLNSKLTPTVTTECPPMDGYEFVNLISDEPQLRNRGFLAFSAMRPPVEVEFKLICPINLHFISISNSVLTQKSTGFEIYAKLDKDDYKLIGKIFTEGIGFTVMNRKFYGRQKPSIPEDYTSCYFRANEQSLLSNLDKIKIRIIKTDKSVPCIGKIEIWGEVSRMCTEKTKETISYLMKPKPTTIMGPENLNEPSTSKVPTNLLDIPDEFFDYISCEIMSLPMTLPCGKTVDQSTLEKHASNDAKWGRVPSDPYTGLPFTETSKPVLNTALKNRIDQFLFENKDKIETKNIQRTVGRKNITLPDYAVTQPSKKMKFIDGDEVKSISTDNLDVAIEEVFSKYNIIRFSKMDKSKSEINNICVFCGKDDVFNLYAIVDCKHLICRLCLLSNPNENICKNCSKPFKKTNVQKWHNS